MLVVISPVDKLYKRPGRVFS